MKVLIIATYFAPELGGGVARYEQEVLPRLLPVLVTAGCEVAVLVLRDGDGLAPAKGVHVLKLPVEREQPWKRILYNQVYGWAYSWGADVVLSLEYWLPFLPLWSKRNISVIHDAHAELAWIRRRKHALDRKFAGLLYWHAACTRGARASDRVITVSQYAAKELSDIFGIPGPKIAVIYCGVDTGWLRPIHDLGAIERVRMRYSLPEQFYLFVGPPTGDKNLRFILQTFLGMEPMDPGVLPVVVTATRPVASPEAELLAQLDVWGRGHLFHFAGRVAHDDLPALYSAARALIFPSLHEGFGLPPVEAMACGTPVLATNRTSVPEIVGGAALTIDPGSPESLRRAIEKVSLESVRQDLIAKGMERARMFNWNRAVQQISAEVLTGWKRSAN